MSNLNEYLGQKREAVLLRNARDPQTVEPVKLRAQVSAEGRSGVRRIRIRDPSGGERQPADFAGYDLGPSSPELLLGSLGSLTHIFLIKAPNCSCRWSRCRWRSRATWIRAAASRATRTCRSSRTTSATPRTSCRLPTRRKCARCTRRWSSGVPSLTCSSVRSRWRARAHAAGDAVAGPGSGRGAGRDQGVGQGAGLSAGLGERTGRSGQPAAHQDFGQRARGPVGRGRRDHDEFHLRQRRRRARRRREPGGGQVRRLHRHAQAGARRRLAAGIAGAGADDLPAASGARQRPAPARA